MVYCRHREGSTIIHLWTVDELIECSNGEPQPEYEDIYEIWRDFAKFYICEERVDACMADLTQRQRTYIERCAASVQAEVNEDWALTDL
jgi:hypothetical protein